MHKRFFFITACILSGAVLAYPLSAQHASNPIQLRVEPAHFSPNGDGFQDQTFFHPMMESVADVSRWRIDIRRVSGKNVKRLTGSGLPSLIPWDGTDAKGKSLPEGSYSVQLSIWGRGLKASAQEMVFIDVTPPVVHVAVSTPTLAPAAEGALVFTPQADDPDGVGRWQLQIMDVEGRTVELLWSTSTLQDIAWDGRDRSTDLFVPPGIYRCAFQAWDKAGNEGSPFFTDVRVSGTPRQTLERALQKIKVYETDAGLLVQLKSSDIFSEGSPSVRVSDAGAELLREVALLVNAYPQVPVRLDGYAIKRKDERSRDRSSLLAWGVYSYLVKYGNVKASRLTVRGRGRLLSPERKAIDMPRLWSGVEIILEGNREW